MQHQLFDFQESNSDHLWATEDMIILSLQPYAFNLIFSGEKKYEFRTRFRKRHTIAFVYVTVPEKCIKGVMVLGQPTIGTPQEIADIAERNRPGNGKSVFDYLEPRGKGYAISILHTQLLPQPLDLDKLRTEFDFIAPQSYINLLTKPGLMEKLCSQINISISNNGQLDISRFFEEGGD